MRRKDREITDIVKVQDIIMECHCCRIGFNDNGHVYIVPLNFGYEQEDGEHIFYFHSAKAGRKISLIEQQTEVGFEMDTNYKLNVGDRACEYSARFQSIIGNGIITMVHDMDEKKKGLILLMKHNTGKESWKFEDKMLNSVSVFKLVVKELSCKEHA